MNAPSFEQVLPGNTAQFEVVVSEKMMDDFRAITGDVNPLHTDDAWALAKGMKGRVVYGLLTASFYSTLVGMHLPGKHALLQSVATSFHAPVYPGTRLRVSGVVADKHELFRRIEIKAKIVTEAGQLVSKATIQAGFV